MSIITTRTSDKLTNIAHQMQAIASAIYAAGYRDECRALEDAAHKVALTALSIDNKIEAGKAAMLRDDGGQSNG